MKVFKPGERAPISGQYEMINRRNKPMNIERTVTKNKSLPPTKSSGQGFVLKDKTKTR